MREGENIARNVVHSSVQCYRHCSPSSFRLLRIDESTRTKSQLYDTSKFVRLVAAA